MVNGEGSLRALVFKESVMEPDDEMDDIERLTEEIGAEPPSTQDVESAGLAEDAFSVLETIRTRIEEREEARRTAPWTIDPPAPFRGRELTMELPVDGGVPRFYRVELGDRFGNFRAPSPPPRRVVSFDVDADGELVGEQGAELYPIGDTGFPTWHGQVPILPNLPPGDWWTGTAADFTGWTGAQPAREERVERFPVGARVSYEGLDGRQNGIVIPRRPVDANDGFRVRWPNGEDYWYRGETTGIQLVEGPPTPEARPVGVFREGDRVRYVYREDTSTHAVPFGTEGTVQPDARPDAIVVVWSMPMTPRLMYQRYWEDRPEWELAALELARGEEMEMVMEVGERRFFREGDRVVYLGPPYNDRLRPGDFGIVQSVDGGINGEQQLYIRWDSGCEFFHGRGETEPQWRMGSVGHIGETPMGVVGVPRAPGEIRVGDMVRGLTANREGIVTRIDAGTGSYHYGSVDGRTGHTNRGDLELIMTVEELNLVRGEERIMTSTASLGPELTGAEKSQLAQWLGRVFENPEADNPYPRGLQDRLGIYFRGRVGIVRGQRWLWNPPYLQVGNQGTVTEGYLPINQRLAICMVLMNLCEPSDALRTQAMQALNRYLLGEYQELSRGTLVTGKTSPDGLAFSVTGDKIAGKVGGDWVLAQTGEPVEVTTEGWTIVSV